MEIGKENRGGAPVSKETCQDRIQEALQSRIESLREYWEAMNSDDDEKREQACDDFNTFGLAFDACPEKGAFIWLLSCGGPQDQFEFNVNFGRNLTSITYRFMDWFDGAAVTLSGKDEEFLRDIWESQFGECIDWDTVMREARA
jgi:hypothetical protein